MHWSGDGRWLYVQRAGLAGGEAEFGAWIDRIEVATGARRPWKELALADPAGFSGGGFAYVTPDGSSCAYQFGSSVGRLYLAEGLR